MFFIRVSWQFLFLPNLHLDRLISSSTVNTKCFYLDILVSQSNFPIQTSCVFSCGFEKTHDVWMGKLFCFVFLNPALAFLLIHWKCIHQIQHCSFCALIFIYFIFYLCPSERKWAYKWAEGKGASSAQTAWTGHCAHQNRQPGPLCREKVSSKPTSSRWYLSIRLLCKENVLWGWAKSRSVWDPIQEE